MTKGKTSGYGVPPKAFRNELLLVNQKSSEQGRKYKKIDKKGIFHVSDAPS